MNTLSENIVVSIIIPAKNEEKHIARCIESIFTQKYQNKVEIIVVDNISTDDTYRIALMKGVQVLKSDANSAAAVRNFGASAAVGQFFAFIDGDCEAPESWLSTGIKLLLGNNSIAACGGSCLPPLHANWIVKSWAPQSRKVRSGMAFALPGSNMIVHSDAFNQIGGFNEKLITAEDDDFCRRLRIMRYDIFFDQQLSVIHHGYPSTIKDVLNKSIWHGSSQLKAHGALKDKTVMLTIFWIMAIICIPIVYFYEKHTALLVPLAIFFASPVMFSMARLKNTNFTYKIIYLLPSYFVCSVSLLGRAIGLLLEVKQYVEGFSIKNSIKKL